MFNKEKLLEAVDMHLTEMLAEQVYQKIQASMQTQWQNVLSELASTRKVNEQLKLELQANQLDHAKLIETLSRYEAVLQEKQVLNKQAKTLLDAAQKDLGLTE